MRKKALHTIFPDSETVHSDSPAQTAFAGLLPTQQIQPDDNSGDSLSAVSRSAKLFGLPANPEQTSNGIALPEVLTDVSKNLDRLRAVTEAQTAETTANTTALGSNTSAKSVGQTVASVGKAAASGFLGGLTSFPLISGLVKLFGGGSDSPTAQPALPKYEAPPSLSFDRAVVNEGSGSQIDETTYDQFGQAKVGASDATSAQSAAQLFSRLIPNAQDTPDYSALLANVIAYAGQSPVNDITGSPTQNLAASPTASAASANTQITVNVQAMDSRSFLDRSHDIAQAVREAMLNMHSINDVVNDL